MPDRYRLGNRNFDRRSNRSWDEQNDWDQDYFDNLRDVNLEDFGRQRNWGGTYSGDWDNRLQDSGFDYYNTSSLGRSNLDSNPRGGRSNFGSRFDDYYRSGMPMRGYAYDYRYGKGIDDWRDTNLEDFGREDNEVDQSFGRGFDYDWEGQTYAPTFHYVEVWDIPGPYTGRGPQGYRRSDERIREDICERLTQHGNVDATGIDVDVHEGEVTLTGTVDRKSDKNTAEDVAYSVAGVDDVHNQIKVDVNDGVRMRGMGNENVVMPGRIQKGMEVYGRNGAFIGRVKFSRANDFLVDRPMARDIYVPYRAVLRTNGDIVLRVAKTDISDQDWEHPELFGNSERSRDRRQPK